MKSDRLTFLDCRGSVSAKYWILAQTNVATLFGSRLIMYREIPSE